MLDEGQVTDCYDRAGAARFRVSRELFGAALEASVTRAFGGSQPDPASLTAYLDRLHVEDLALACACASGDSDAWDHFMRTYRQTLYSAAHSIDPSGNARELADSLYADLYGLGRATAERRSLFRYFHGRSSLATWLRSVLAQRHVDLLRERRRIEPLPEGETELSASVPTPVPERFRFVVIMRTALANALASLVEEDRLRLACYYGRRMTLAQIGRLTGEHEATVSRHLARARTLIRRAVEWELHSVHGLTDDAIAECFESVAADPGPLDLRDLLGRKNLDEDRSRDEGCV